MKPFLKDLPTVTLRPSPPPVVRHSFFVVDTSPDHKPAWIIPDRLAVGSQDCAFNEECRSTFSHIVNVGYDIPNAFEAEGIIKYLKMDVSDLAEFQLVDAFEKVNEFIDNALQDSSSKSKVFIHCQAGVSRSISVAAAYLMLVRARRGENPSLDDVLAEIRKTRPQALPNAGFMAQLKEYERELRMRYVVCRMSETEARNLEAIRRSNSASLPVTKRRDPTLQVRLLRLAGQLVFAYHLLRPSATILSFVVALVKLIRNRSLSKFWLLLGCLLAYDLSKDDAFRANAFGRLSKGARPGVFYHEGMQNIVSKLPRLSQDQTYRVPLLFKLLGADFTTVSYLAFGYHPVDLTFQRELVSEIVTKNGQTVERKFSLDWAFPKAEKTVQRGAQDVCLFLSGIGGDSSSPYVRSVAEKLLDDGLVVAVLLARGLGICSCAEHLDKLFDPTDDGDVHLAVTRLSKLYRRVMIIGFSLGGITACRYFSLFADEIPENVKGCMSISGGFRIGFITNPRYENVYQGVLVPGLVDDIVSKYGEELERRMGSVHPVLSSLTYRDIHKSVYNLGKLPGAEADFEKWRVKMESCPSKVKKPLLLVTALDDPLHHPEQLGLNKLWDSSAEDPHPSKNVIVVCTNGGGHVAWPEGNFATEGYTYLRSIASDFFKAILDTNE